MPKLSSKAMEKRKARIEDAAKQLFIKQGFHATSMRNIAARAGNSLGNVYNYYRTKEEIFSSIVTKYQKVIDARLRSIFDQIEDPLQPDSLVRFGRLIKEMVNEHHDFWLLMYIDVLEFENRHFRKMFEGLAQNLRRRFAKPFEEMKRREQLHEGLDPAIGFTAVYMQFFNYFLVEKLFGGNKHFGISDEQVISKLSEIYARGLLRESQPRAGQKHKQSSADGRSAARSRRPLKNQAGSA